MGGYKLWQDIEGKIATEKKSKQDEIDKKEYEIAIKRQNKDIEEDLLRNYNNCIGAYICVQAGISVDRDNPRLIKRLYEIVYPIKGDLKPNDRLIAIYPVEVLTNGDVFNFYSKINRNEQPFQIVFDDSGANTNNKIVKTGTSTTKELFWPIPPPITMGNDSGYPTSSHLFEVLKGIGWDKQMHSPAK